MKIICFHTWTCTRSHRINKTLQNRGHKIKTLNLFREGDRENPFIKLGYGINVSYLFDSEVEVMNKREEKISTKIKEEIEKYDPEIIISFDNELSHYVKSYTEKKLVHIVKDVESLYDNFFENNLDRKIKNIKEILKQKNLKISFKKTLIGLKKNIKKVTRKGECFEKKAYEKAELVVFPTNEMLNYSKRNYKLKETLVVPNAILKEDYPKKRLSKISKKDEKMHLVHVGKLPKSFQKAFRKITERGDTIHIYEYSKKSKKIKGVIYEKPLHYKDLLVEISKYDAGLFLGYRKTPHFDAALANKFFDYASAGIPIISEDYAESKNFIEKFNAGFVIKNTQDIFKLKLDKIHPKKNKEFLMDYHVDKLENRMKKIK